MYNSHSLFFSDILRHLCLCDPEGWCDWEWWGDGSESEAVSEKEDWLLCCPSASYGMCFGVPV